MNPPINLNRVRKAKIRAEAIADATRNRVSHGRTKAEKAAALAERAAAARALDQSRREP